jgi:hypothetical protein
MSQSTPVERKRPFDQVMYEGPIVAILPDRYSFAPRFWVCATMPAGNRVIVRVESTTLLSFSKFQAAVMNDHKAVFRHVDAERQGANGKKSWTDEIEAAFRRSEGLPE